MTKGWEEARTILCVRLDTIGDVLMTTPAIRAIKERTPGRRILFLTSPSGARIASLVPEIDDILVYQAPWMKATPQRENSAADLETMELLKDMEIDAAVIFNVYSQNPLPAALLCYLADIRLRLAYCRENPYQLLTDWIPDPEPQEFVRHEVRRQLDLVEAINCRTDNENLSLQYSRRASRRVLQLLKEQGMRPAERFLVFHPGATASSRRYPSELFVQVARHAVLDLHMPVVFTGEETERGSVETIRTGMGAPSVSLAGLLDLDELAALLAMTPLLVSNNTGPVHMAAALGTPVVDLYALTNPQHSPWNVSSRVLSHDVPCKYCYKSTCPEGHHDCLRLVHPDLVIEAIKELLPGLTSPPPRAKLVEPPPLSGSRPPDQSGLSRSLLSEPPPLSTEAASLIDQSEAQEGSSFLADRKERRVPSTSAQASPFTGSRPIDSTEQPCAADA